MMHTKGKWVVKEDVLELHTDWYIETKNDVIGEIYSEANAKRIVQMHNSFDGLLEACKDILKYEKQNSGSSLRIERLERAIAKAEKETT